MPSLPTHGNIQKLYMRYNKSNCFTKLTAIQHVSAHKIVYIYFLCDAFVKSGFSWLHGSGKASILWKLFLKLEKSSRKSSKTYKVSQDKKKF
jgi:hypothetical protein